MQKNRQYYPGEWLPEPIVAKRDQAFNNAEKPELGLGMLKLLEKLNPFERAVFILRDVLEFDYAAVAEFTGREEAHCRQLGKRARNALQLKQPEGSFSVAIFEV